MAAELFDVDVQSLALGNESVGFAGGLGLDGVDRSDGTGFGADAGGSESLPGGGSVGLVGSGEGVIGFPVGSSGTGCDGWFLLGVTYTLWVTYTLTSTTKMPNARVPRILPETRLPVGSSVFVACPNRGDFLAGKLTCRFSLFSSRAFCCKGSSFSNPRASCWCRDKISLCFCARRASS